MNTKDKDIKAQDKPMGSQDKEHGEGNYKATQDWFTFRHPGVTGGSTLSMLSLDFTTFTNEALAAGHWMVIEDTVPADGNRLSVGISGGTSYGTVNPKTQKLGDAILVDDTAL